VPVGVVPDADFALWTLAPPQPLRDFVAHGLPAGPPLLAVSSERGTFELRLYAASRVTSASAAGGRGRPPPTPARPRSR
jgi:hypothetical protein